MAALEPPFTGFETDMPENESPFLTPLELTLAPPPVENMFVLNNQNDLSADLSDHLD